MLFGLIVAVCVMCIASQVMPSDAIAILIIIVLVNSAIVGSGFMALEIATRVHVERIMVSVPTAADRTDGVNPFEMTR